MISVIRRWAGSGGWKARWRCDANALSAVQAAWSRRASRASLGRRCACARFSKGKAPDTTGLRPRIFPHRIGSPAAVDRHPCRKARRLKRYVHRGPCGANLKHCARDAGKPALRGEDCLCIRTHIMHRAAGRFGAPAFRAPSLLEGEGRLVRRSRKAKAEAGNANVDDGLPGAAQEYGR